MQSKFVKGRAYHGKRYVSPSHVSSFNLPTAKGKGKRLSDTLFAVEYGILPYQFFEL